MLTKQKGTFLEGNLPTKNIPIFKLPHLEGAITESPKFMFLTKYLRMANYTEGQHLLRMF